MKELTFNPQINVQQCVLWQYANSPALRTLLQAKSDFYEQNVTQFWNDWFNDVFNINTATDFGLTVWGEILDFPRQVKANDGQIHILTTEQYRTILKGQLLKFRMDGTAPQINEWLNVVFGSQGNVYCLDNLDMTAIPFVFETNPSDEILWLLSNVDFLPRPAGVGYEVRIVGKDVFGFNGSGLQPFNQGTFYKNWNTDLDIEKGQYQLSVNAPTGAIITINGISGNYQSMTEGTQYTYSVTQDGYISLQGSGTLTQDTTITVNALRIVTNTPNASIILNGENKNGAFFLSCSSFAYTYAVSAIGYNSQSGSGTATGNQIITANLTAQSYSETISGIVSDGTGIRVLKNFTAPYTGNYKISLKAEGGYGVTGRYQTSDGIANGGICNIKIFLQEGAPLTLGKINGTGYNFPANHGGAGLYCYKGADLVAVAGGGGMKVSPGGGYVGGYGENYRVGDAPNIVFYGYSIDGTQPNSKETANTTRNVGSTGGGTSNWYGSRPNVYFSTAYGGSGYANPDYNVEQIYGGSGSDAEVLQGNYGQGSITIEYTGQN